MSRFHVLGSGTRGPSPQRQTACHLLETRRGWILFDAGSGVSRLHDPLFREMATRYRRALVLLGDYTHDRLAGLPHVPQFLGGMEVIVAGPGPVEETVGRFLADPFFPGGLSAWIDTFSAGVTFATLLPGENRVGGELVQVLESSAGTPVALRVRDVSYAPGLEATDSLRAFAGGASLLVLDVQLHHPGDSEAANSVTDAARLAEEAGVQDLLLGHLPGEVETGTLEQLQFHAAALFPRVVVAADMMCLRMTGGPEEELEAGNSVVGAESDADDGAEPNPGETQNGEGAVDEADKALESL